MQINNNTDLKKTRDIFQKIVDILDEGIEIDKREKTDEIVDKVNNLQEQINFIK